MNAKNVFGLVIILMIVALAIVFADASDAESPAEDRTTLLGMLAEWQYPEATFHGAKGSDGGHAGVVSVKCQAVLTTTDPVDKVIEFYANKLDVAGAAQQPSEVAEPEKVDARSVSMLDDSAGRPVTVRVFVVNKAETSTTLVISRAENDTETHIAWSHYRHWPEYGQASP